MTSPIAQNAILSLQWTLTQITHKISHALGKCTVSGSTTRIHYMEEKGSATSWLLLQQKTCSVLNKMLSDSVDQSHCFGGDSSFRINWSWRPCFSETWAHICQNTWRHTPENKSWNSTQNHTMAMFLNQLITVNRKILLRKITSRILGHCCHKFVAFKWILTKHNIINEPTVVNAQPEGAGENTWT